MQKLFCALVLTSATLLAGCGRALPSMAAERPAGQQAVRKVVRQAEVKLIAVTDAAALVKANAKIVFIDVRNPDEYATGHAPGAVLHPLPDVDTWAAKLDRQAPTVLICRSGHRSGLAAQRLVELGFTDVTSVQGGMIAWTQANLPVVQ